MERCQTKFRGKQAMPLTDEENSGIAEEEKERMKARTMFDLKTC